MSTLSIVVIVYYAIDRNIYILIVSVSFVNSPNTPLCYVKETEMQYHSVCVMQIITTDKGN